MAGLVAAARLRELGHEPVVFEKGTRPGGSMLLSSCVPWRHREFEQFREECPDGDEALQRLVWERFDDAIDWLERTTRVEPVWDDTENPLTTGRRFDPLVLTEALVDRAGPIRFSEPGPTRVDFSPLILATGGFPVRIARERGLLRRSNRWSEGDGLDTARSLGAATAGDLGEFYGRAMPAPPARVSEQDYIDASQIYGRLARHVNELGEPFFNRRPAWHESDLAQAIARQPGGTAWLVLPRVALDTDRVRAVRELGGTVLVEGKRIRVHVGVGVTHTLGGIRVDTRARALRDDGSPIEGLYAAGVDVGAIASGGYASGVAQALVLGLVAAEAASS